MTGSDQDLVLDSHPIRRPRTIVSLEPMDAWPIEVLAYGTKEGLFCQTIVRLHLRNNEGGNRMAPSPCFSNEAC